MIHLHAINNASELLPKVHLSGYSGMAERVWIILRLLEEQIRTHQLPTGGFLLWRSDKPTMDDYIQVPCVFLSAVQAATQSDIRFGSITSIVERSRDFIVREKSENDLWRFFGRDSAIGPDIDDTFYCLAASSGVARSTVKSALDRILNVSASQEPLLPTWYRSGPNSVDHTVNANVLHCLGILGYKEVRVNTLASEIHRILLSGAFLEGSPYYPDPLCFILSYARALKYHSELASDAARQIINVLLEDKIPRLATQLQLSMALEISLWIHAEPEVISNIAEALLKLFEKSPRCEASPWFRHRSVEMYYGAPAATAVFAFSALNCYLQHSHIRRCQYEKGGVTHKHLHR